MAEGGVAGGGGRLGLQWYTRLLWGTLILIYVFLVEDSGRMVKS